MTKEELKKEAIKYAVDYSTSYGKGYKHKDLRIAYLAGAEPREKRIEELIALINAERERQEKCDDVHLRKIAELEKENAELKAQIENDRDLPVIAYQQGAESYKRKADKQLTKAKEILKAVVDFYPTMTATILLEAVQFLSEVEK